MSKAGQPPYTEKSRRKSLLSVAMVGGLFIFAAIVFGVLFGAGNFIAGS